MFETWADALQALAAAAVLASSVRILANVRGLWVQWPFEPEVPSDRSRHEPVDAVDMRYGLIGQTREDNERLRRTAFWTVLSAAGAQLLLLAAISPAPWSSWSLWQSRVALAATRKWRPGSR